MYVVATEFLFEDPSREKGEKIASMKLTNNAVVAFAYGACVIASGLYRFFSEEGGHAGLWFGIVMGGLALVAGGCFALQKSVFGHVLAWLTIAIVGGWFFYEALIKKGWAESETRLLLVLGLTVVVAGLLAQSVLRTRKQ